MDSDKGHAIYQRIKEATFDGIRADTDPIELMSAILASFYTVCAVCDIPKEHYTAILKGTGEIYEKGLSSRFKEKLYNN